MLFETSMKYMEPMSYTSEEKYIVWSRKKTKYYIFLTFIFSVCVLRIKRMLKMFLWFLGSFNRKYLNWTKLDLSLFAFKLFIVMCNYSVYTTLFNDTTMLQITCIIVETCICAFLIHLCIASIWLQAIRFLEWKIWRVSLQKG